MKYRAISLSSKKEGTSRKEKSRKEVLQMRYLIWKILKFVNMEAEKGAVISSLHRDMENLIPVTLKENGKTQQEVMFSTQGKKWYSLP